MKGLIVIILGIAALLLVVGGAAGYALLKDAEDESGSVDSLVNKVLDRAGDAESGDGSPVSDIVGEVEKFNEQNGEGYYREVTYSDGGFRQYDSETGELIGSSYESDQDKLPSLE